MKYLDRVENYFRSSDLTRMNINELYEVLGKPDISLSKLVKSDHSRRFSLTGTNEIVLANPQNPAAFPRPHTSALSGLDYLDHVSFVFTAKNIQKLSINKLYDICGAPKDGLSSLVKFDPKKRFQLTARSEIKRMPTVSDSGNPAAPKPLGSDSGSTVIKANVSDSEGFREPLAVSLSTDQENNGFLNFQYVIEPLQVQSILDILTFNSPKFIALDIEFKKSDSCEMAMLLLIQIAFIKADGKIETYVLDAIDLEGHLKGLMEKVAESTLIIHDARMETVLLRHWFQISISRLIDTQLVYELIEKVPFGSLFKFLGLASYSHALKKKIHKEMDQGFVWKKPYSKELLMYAAEDARLLFHATKDLTLDFIDPRIEQWIALSSKHIASFSFPDLAKEMGFDQEYKITSRVLLDQETKIDPLEISFDLSELQPILPPGYFEALKAFTNIRDLILDLNERPRVYFHNSTFKYLFEDSNLVFRPNDMEYFIEHLEIGTDNRAILNGSFHRISVMKNLKGAIYGITVRMGRFVSGLASILGDIIHSDASILYLGPPGTGKSSFIRDSIRMLGKTGLHIVVVDTSNELCGNGDYVHPLLYPARRVMVPTLEKQKQVMIEAVQNHTPDVLIIDEIGRPNEVVAAKTVRARGVRIIASAHGTFEDLFKNKDLNGLLGGFEQVTLSDKMAEQHDYRKLKVERSGSPVFDVIVELKKGSTGHIEIYQNVASKVDAKLENEKFVVEERWHSGSESMFVRLQTK